MQGKNKVFNILSNISFVIGVLFVIYYVYSYISTRTNLPAGVCPFDQNRPIAFAASGFLVLSLVLSFFEVKKQRKTKKQADKEESSTQDHE